MNRLKKIKAEIDKLEKAYVKSENTLLLFQWQMGKIPFKIIEDRIHGSGGKANDTE